MNSVKKYKNFLFSLSLAIFLNACGAQSNNLSDRSSVSSSIEEVPEPKILAIIPSNPISNTSPLFSVSSIINKSGTIDMDIDSATHFNVPSLPSWAVLNQDTGVLTISPNNEFVGHKNFDLEVTVNSEVIKIQNGLRISIYKPLDKLANEIAKIESVDIIKTGAQIRTTSGGGTYFITNQDNLTHTAISYFFERYNINGRLTAVDVETNTVKSVILEEEMEGEGWNGVMMVPLGNGRAMFSYNKRGYQEVSVYDTKTHTWDRNVASPPATHRINVMNAITYSTGGKIFTLGVNAHDGTAHPTLMQIDPDTYETRFYGNIGEGGYFGQQIVADRTYVYVLTGRVPYRITQVRISDGEQTPIAVGPDLWLRQHKGGVLIGYGGNSYFMYEGVQNLITRGQFARSDAPWPKVDGECNYKNCYNVTYVRKFASAFDTSSDAPINNTFTSYRWYQKEYKGSWDYITTPNIPIYQSKVFDVKIIPEIDKIFYGGDRYSGFILQDAFDNSFERVSNTTGTVLSYYNSDYTFPYLTMTGYPNGQTIVYDVREPWEKPLRSGVNYDPDNKTKQESKNPINLGHMNKFSGNHKNHSVTTGNDGFLYFGGQWMRNGVGGGVEWYNMQTKEHGGIRKGFEDCWVMEMKAVGDYIALGCRKISGSSAFEIRMLNTKTKVVEYVITPDSTIKAVGEWVNFKDENILISSRSKDGQANLMNINVIKKRVVYNKNLGVSSNFGIYENVTGAYSIVLNDGFGYMNARGNVIMRFDPNTGNIEPVLRYKNYSSKFGIYKDKI